MPIATALATPAMVEPVVQPMQLPEEVFMDAFAQGAAVAQNSMVIKETPFFEQVHAFANVAALLAIIIFVAL